MNKMHFLAIAISLFTSISLQAQEICDNAIDDDGDGLIDLNDDECQCNTVIPSSLIPNPSFEEMTCCPTDNAELNCAVGWIQASEATSDYVHTCGGYLGNTSIPAFAPLPFPDGEGGVAFRDGQEFAGSNYKEYIGACLTEKMEVGVTYRIDFFVGFQDNVPGSMQIDIALFGATNCSLLPFGGTNLQVGCPLNVPNYVQLAQQNVSGSNEWVNTIFEFTADQEYEVIIIGPSCSPNSNYQKDPYFYVDRLTLAESTEFGIPFESVTGSICENNLILQAEDDGQSTFQWYFNGIAMIGETNSSLSLTSIDNQEGIYLVIITTPEGCQNSQEYDLRIPPYYAPVEVDICENETYEFGADILTQSGYYERLLPALDGCDSIIQLTLNVNAPSNSEIRDTFCFGDVYTFYDITTTEGGVYETTLKNAVGCDSIITLELMSINQGIGVDLKESSTINLGETISLEPIYYNPSYTTFIWWDDNGNLISNELEVPVYRPLQTSTVFINAISPFGCSYTDSMEIRVISNHTLFVPNAFSPDGNGINDYFRFYPPISVDRIQSFLIFDRWGGIAYDDKLITEFEGYLGWDGTIDGKKANQGVYCYLIEASFLDGTEKLFTGDLILLR